MEAELLPALPVHQGPWVGHLLQHQPLRTPLRVDCGRAWQLTQSAPSTAGAAAEAAAGRFFVAFALSAMGLATGHTATAAAGPLGSAAAAGRFFDDVLAPPAVELAAATAEPAEVGHGTPSPLHHGPWSGHLLQHHPFLTPLRLDWGRILQFTQRTTFAATAGAALPGFTVTFTSLVIVPVSFARPVVFLEGGACFFNFFSFL
mmetsp:Transcript_20885/g.38102  ORF Transcript_20885/g.38102 Transcript_20885/m.38102 type:complete len:203 (+) Transcript_20885:267-875(+)